MAQTGAGILDIRTTTGAVPASMLLSVGERLEEDSD
jgi:hypothetical protein